MKNYFFKPFRKNDLKIFPRSIMSISSLCQGPQKYSLMSITGNKHLLCGAIKDNNIEFVDYLLENGINITFEVLKETVQSDNCELLKKLVKHGADVTITNNEHQRGLLLCVNSVKMFKLLIEFGADYRRENFLFVYLYWLTLFPRPNWLELCKYCIQHKLYDIDECGPYLLYKCIYINHGQYRYEMMKLLLEHGADDIRNKNTFAVLTSSCLEVIPLCMTYIGIDNRDKYKDALIQCIYGYADKNFIALLQYNIFPTIDTD